MKKLITMLAVAFLCSCTNWEVEIPQQRDQDTIDTVTLIEFTF
jgi:hypothetical protein